MVLTCYIDFDAVQVLINQVNSTLRLSEAFLLFDYSEIYRHRTPAEAGNALSELTDLCLDQNITFQWRALRAGALMHAKAVAVIQHLQSSIEAGCIWITSGNATNRGLGIDDFANFEMSSFSTAISEIKGLVNLYRYLENNHAVPIDKPVQDSRDYGFAYGLLASGIFLHKWSMPLSAQTSLRYALTPKGRQEAVQVRQELTAQGFNLEAGTMSKPLIGFSTHKVLPRTFSKSYTIDTLLGRWCPRSVWAIVEEQTQKNEAFRKFVVEFRRRTSRKRLEQIVENEAENETQLLAREWVEEDLERLSRWRSRIEEIRNNEKRLSRIYLDFAAFELPYSFEGREDVLETYESLQDSMSLLRAQTVVVRKVQSAAKYADLARLDLTEDERDELISKLR